MRYASLLTSHLESSNPKPKICFRIPDDSCVKIEYGDGSVDYLGYNVGTGGDTCQAVFGEQATGPLPSVPPITVEHTYSESGVFPVHVSGMSKRNIYSISEFWMLYGIDLLVSYFHFICVKFDFLSARNTVMKLTFRYAMKNLTVMNCFFTIMKCDEKIFCKNIHYTLQHWSVLQKVWNFFHNQWLWETIEFNGLYLVFFYRKRCFK